MQKRLEQIKDTAERTTPILKEPWIPACRRDKKHLTAWKHIENSSPEVVAAMCEYVLAHQAHMNDAAYANIKRFRDAESSLAKLLEGGGDEA